MPRPLAVMFLINWDHSELKSVDNFLEDQKINVAPRVLTRKNAPPTAGHVFQVIVTIFELVEDIIETNLLTKFHEDRTIHLASRVLTSINAPPPWRPCFSSSRNHFRTHRTINVASTVLTRHMLTPHDGQKAITKAHSAR
ncbi:hypothetical protein DPMN_071392 [Dreissena polymorpha]|uniref:Uncharacterized protein n=1 Tax=Dreissena polymorpha TaxID=45954 RepID=A0A9D3Z2J0_DREPO|nr:hypothetical protein DPMN_071392 [Dreissena polymorpha]